MQTTTTALSPELDDLWQHRHRLSAADRPAVQAVTEAIELLERGEARVAGIDADTDTVVVDERAKRAIMLAFAVLPMTRTRTGPYEYHDRIPLKQRFDGVRVVPGAVARRGSYHASGVVLMPSFTNIGAYVDTGTMVDTWATVGSCAQVGRNVHLAGGAGIGGVLEPANAVPVIIEDDAFIGSRAAVVEGARVRRGAKLGAGAVLTASTRVFDAATGEELPRGEAPERSVCIPATRVRHYPGGDFGVSCLLVIRTLAEGEVHDKLALEDLFRTHR
jgi:2,3,4,5-tetrahydropyridine-2-carboxylate N-succinyltransferase